LWVWFLISMYRHLKLRDSGQNQLPLLSEALIVATFVVMHFSYYPFSFIGWIPIWYIFGLSVASAKVAVTTRGRSMGMVSAPQRLLPESGTGREGNFGGTPQLS
jgi:hypothetical protein